MPLELELRIEYYTTTHDGGTLYLCFTHATRYAFLGRQVHNDIVSYDPNPCDLCREESVRELSKDGDVVLPRSTNIRAPLEYTTERPEKCPKCGKEYDDMSVRYTDEEGVSSVPHCSSCNIGYNEYVKKMHAMGINMGLKIYRKHSRRRSHD